MSSGSLNGKSLALKSLTVNGVEINGGGGGDTIAIIQSGTAIWASATNGYDLTLPEPLPATGTFFVLAGWQQIAPPATPKDFGATIGAQNPANGDTKITFDSGVAPQILSPFNWAVIRLPPA